MEEFLVYLRLMDRKIKYLPQQHQSVIPLRH
jgi:hypothetical protein